MKKPEKKTLSLDKFRVAELGNLQSIRGGDGQETKTTKPKKSEKCNPPPTTPFCSPSPDSQQ